MDSLKLFTPAKINLYLDVVKLLDNGYHEIQSVMQTVTLFDELIISKANSGITIETNDDTLERGKKNIVYRAAESFFIEAGIDFNLSGLNIVIIKNIPISAGLAGGSTDAAATLRGLNKLYGFPLSVDKLLDISASLGADVPFCFCGGTMLAEGIGTDLKPLPPLPDCFIVIANSGMLVSSADSYAKLDKLGVVGKDDSDKLDKMIYALENSNLLGVIKNMYNKFEHIDDECYKLKKIMLSNGATGALMSGSGPSVFGVFDNNEMASSTAKILAAIPGVKSFVCRPCGI